MGFIIPSKKILIILTDAKSFPLHKTSGPEAGKTVQQPSGFFLRELAKPLQKILDAGYEVTFASPKGLEPEPDPLSESLAAFAGNFYERQRENELIDRMKRENGFNRPRPLSTISDEELDSFAGVFIPGGHAPLSDLGNDKEVGRVLRHFHEKKKPTASLCHGPVSFLSTKKAGDGSFIYKGYKITCWSDAEEKVMETMWGGEIPKVESALRNEGAEMVEGPGEKIGTVTVDRELVTGGNPQAAGALGDRFLQMLSVH
jgi:putative intracellular protease/amidase